MRISFQDPLCFLDFRRSFSYVAMFVFVFLLNTLQPSKSTYPVLACLWGIRFCAIKRISIRQVGVGLLSHTSLGGSSKNLHLDISMYVGLNNVFHIVGLCSCYAMKHQHQTHCVCHYIHVIHVSKAFTTLSGLKCK